MLPDLQLNDTVRMRKSHPCGSYEWKVVRLGADIGIECSGCGRRVILPRRQLARRVKTISHSDQQYASAAPPQSLNLGTPKPTLAEELAKRPDDPGYL